MPDMKVFLELIAKSDKFQQGMQQGERALSGFRSWASKTARDVEYLTQKIGFLGTAATALSTGLVLKKLFSLADFMPVDDALLRMQVNLKTSAKELDKFKNQLSDLAGHEGLDQGKTFQSAYKLSHAYRQEDILQIIKASDMAAKALKQDIDPVQDRLVQIMKLYKLAPSEAHGVAEALAASRVDMETLDTILQRLALRGGSKKDYTQTLGMLLGLKKAGMDNPRSVGQVNEVLEMIQNKADLLQRSGVRVYDIDRTTGEKKWRDQIEVLKDLQSYLAKYKKTLTSEKYNELLNKAFGDNADNKLAFVFRQLDNFQKGIKDMGNAAQTAAERSAAAEKTWEEQLNKIKSNLAGIKNDLSWIYDLAKKPMKFAAESPNATKTAGYAAAGLSALVLGGLAYGKGKEILRGLGKTGAGIAAGKAIETATGVTPVFVTNWPAGGIGTADGVPGAAGKGGKLLSLAKNIPMLATAGMVGYGLGSVFNNLLGSVSDKMSGGKYKGEGWLGNMLYDFMHRDGSKTETKNDIKLNITIDQQNRVTANNGNTRNTNVSVDLNRGSWENPLGAY